MNTKLIASTAVALALSALSLTAQAAYAPNPLLGDVVTPAAGDRVIAIDAGTKFINVRSDETVTFRANGKEFAVKFDGNSSAFDLASIAPQGTLDHSVTAYVMLVPRGY